MVAFSSVIPWLFSRALPYWARLHQPIIVVVVVVLTAIIIGSKRGDRGLISSHSRKCLDFTPLLRRVFGLYTTAHLLRLPSAVPHSFCFSWSKVVYLLTGASPHRCNVSITCFTIVVLAKSILARFFTQPLLHPFLLLSRNFSLLYHFPLLHLRRWRCHSRGPRWDPRGGSDWRYCHRECIPEEMVLEDAATEDVTPRIN